MQPCSREMQSMNSIMNQSQLSLQDLQNQQQIANPQIHHFDAASSHDDFLDQMLSSLPSCPWPDPAGGHSRPPWDLSSAGGTESPDDRGPENATPHQFHFDHDQSAVLAAKLRQHQIGGSGANPAAVAARSLLLQQQLLMQSRGMGGAGGGLRSPTGGSGTGESTLLPMPLNLGSGDNQGGDGSAQAQALYNGFNGSQHFQHPQGGTMQAQNYGTPAAAAASGSAGSGAPAAQPKQRVRARRGQATDPHSIAERLRRERIAERMKALQELVPNANKTDKASMLDEIIDYVKFLQLQVKVLSMSRLGGAAAVAPLVADMSSEGAGDCGGGRAAGNCGHAAASNGGDGMKMTEQQVAKLMEEDMGSAMQYLQGKGLCLMPISLATAISTATCHSRTTPLSANFLAPHGGATAGDGGGGGGPSSPSMSVLTVQSAATMGNGIGGDASVKDAASVSKP
ncbi:hypothetical protein NMG60_11005170 [Bertholletia excelsa]